jgi:hypothetical protein
MNESEKFQEGESWPIEQRFGPEEWLSRSFGEPPPDKRPEAGPEVTQ